MPPVRLEFMLFLLFVALIFLANQLLFLPFKLPLQLFDLDILYFDVGLSFSQFCVDLIVLTGNDLI